MVDSLWLIQHASYYLNIVFVDYLITRLDGTTYYSYQEHRKHD